MGFLSRHTLSERLQHWLAQQPAQRLPSIQALDRLHEEHGRVRLVVKARWMTLLLLVGFGIASGSIFAISDHVLHLGPAQLVSVVTASTAVVVNNLLLQSLAGSLRTFQWLNPLQIVTDLLFVTLLVHVSGGVLSWFWTAYLIVMLEAAFLLGSRRQVWLFALLASICYAVVLFLEFRGLLVSNRMPFVIDNLQQEPIYLGLHWLWVSSMVAAQALACTFFFSAIRERETLLSSLVITDQMTGLYNRAYFFRMLGNETQRSARYQTPFSVALLDLDDFKALNDRHGHQAGDRVLIAVAKVLRGAVRRRETPPAYDIDFPCRYGGEEFAVLLPETSLYGTPLADGSRSPSALGFAERIRRDIEQLDVDGLKITVSIGLATYPGCGSDADSLVRAADEALYQAKREGKNRVVAAVGGKHAAEMP